MAAARELETPTYESCHGVPRGQRVFTGYVMTLNPASVRTQRTVRVLSSANITSL